jgi:beta-glucosidase
VSVPKGERVMVELDVTAESLQHWDPVNKAYAVAAGEYEFQIGAASDDIRMKTQVTLAAKPGR